jgi:hypothetical protein
MPTKLSIITVSLNNAKGLQKNAMLAVLVFSEKGIQQFSAK